MAKQIKILVIDDDPFLNKVYINKFAQEGFLVLTSMDGVSGMQKIRDQHPSLVVMDIVLPGMSGYEIMQTMKSDSALSDIPVLIVTNLGQTKDIQQAMGLGAVDYLIKTNFTIDDILERIRGYIEVQRVHEVDVSSDEAEQARWQQSFPGTKMKLSQTRENRLSGGKVVRCPKCGISVVPGTHFCPNCGTRL